MIEFHDVIHRYRDDAPAALDGVSLRFEPGEFLAVVGSNGSGKSTLAKSCDGLLSPTAGRVIVDGIDTAEQATIWDVRSRVAMVFQDPDDQIVGTVVEEDCAFGPENLGVPSAEIRRRVEGSLAAVGLSGLERREPHLLSEGQKQRLAIAGALAMRPRYLVFDEPTAMLDPAGRRAALDIMRRLADEGEHGVLLVSHDAADVARADRVIGLRAGRVIFEGSPEELFADAATLSDVGMALSPSGRLAEELRARGMDVPAGAADPERLVAALWR